MAYETRSNIYLYLSGVVINIIKKRYKYYLIIKSGNTACGTIEDSFDKKISIYSVHKYMQKTPNL